MSLLYSVRKMVPMDLLIPIDAETYSGGKADEAPRAFHLAGERFLVEEVVDRWYQAGRDPRLPSASYFKVRTADGTLYLLKRDNETARWFLARSSVSPR